MKLGNKAYDVLKIVLTIARPFVTMVASIIIAIATGGDTTAIVLAIVEAIDTFLGCLMKISSDEFFSTRDIVDKVVPDTEEL